jgi:aldehyde dehydrogenase (NAD+)
MQHSNLIAGEWVGADSSTRNINPSDTNDIIGEYASSAAKQVDAAIDAANQAFAAWSRSSPQLRAELLDKVGTEILARRAELADLLAREEGKTRAEATGEVGRAGQIFKFFAGEAVRLAGDLQDSLRPGVEVDVTREPVGVVGIITPWNFPIAIPSWKIAPALAFGNCVVFKPAELVPGSAWALADIIQRAGVPAGVFNLVLGKGSVIGDALVRSNAIHALTFTGSVEVGRRLRVETAERGLRLQLEMGGKNPLIVLGDAELGNAVQVALDGGFFATGQRCTASSRLIVQDTIHDAFVEALSAALRNQVVDDSRKAGTTIGPVVDARQLEQDLKYIRLAVEEGGRLVQGGREVKRSTPGYYLEPALFAETTNGMRINREEVFGPVASVIRVHSYDEALNIANDTAFGLCAGLCTRSLKYAHHFRRNSQAGMVMINLPTAGVDYHVPFGGSKASSYGPREQGRYAADFYTSRKTTYIKADT